MAKKNRIMTPRGTASFPWVRKADTKYNPKGEFKCNIILNEDDPDTQALIKQLEAQRDEIVADLKNDKFQWLGDTLKLKPYEKDEVNIHPVYERLRDDNTGEYTGQIVIKAKQNAVYGKDSEYKANIAVVNSKGNPDATLNVFGGDTIKMLITADGFWFAKDKLIGLTIRLVAVQVIESNGAGGGDFGFGDEGDGAMGNPNASADDSQPSFVDEYYSGTPDDQAGADF